MESTNNKGEGLVAVYLSFKTFQSAIQSLRTHGLPTVLDRTAFDSRSGAEQTQILSAFKFLGLIDDQQRTQPTLRKLRDAQENSADEKALIGELLKQRYPKVFDLDLENTTMGALETAIGEYGAGGTTRDRAVRFFIKAAEHAGIKMSSRLTKGQRTRSSSGRSSANEDGVEGNGGAVTTRTRGKRRKSADRGNATPATGNAVKTITLREDRGTLTLSGTFDAFDLDGDERELVYGIVDLMKAYERKS